MPETSSRCCARVARFPHEERPALRTEISRKSCFDVRRLHGRGADQIIEVPRQHANLLGAGDQQSWTSHAATLEAGVEQGIDEASERLALQYAAVATDETVRSLVVEGVQGLEDYARVSKYLASLTPVDRVQVARVSGQELEFSLNLSSEERNLLQLITLGRVLQPIEEPSAWRFRLNP